MSKLLSTYIDILAYAGLSADAGGFISLKNGDKLEPAFIEGKRIVLPTLEQLRSSDIATKEVFHPLYEVPWKAETAVQKKFLQAVNLKLNTSIAGLAIALLRLATSPAQHGSLTPEQSQFLYGIDSLDEKTLAEFTTAMNSQLKANGAERTFVNLYVRRGGTKAGKKYARLGVVTWLFYDKLADPKSMKISEKRVNAIKQLFTFMFPEIADAEAYSYGTDCNVAPYFKALMYTAAMISARLNELIKLYETYITDAKSLMFDESCLEKLQDLSKLSNEIQLIPSQDDAPAEDAKPQKPATADIPPWETPQPAANSYQPPPPQHQQAQPPKGPLDLRAFNNSVTGGQGMSPPQQQNWGWGGQPQSSWGPPPPPGWGSPNMGAPAPSGWGDSWQQPGPGWGQTNTGWGAMPQQQQNWGGYNNPNDPIVRTVYGHMPRSQALMRGYGYTNA